jgi:hypothetical protein
MNYLHLIFFGMLFEKNWSDFPPTIGCGTQFHLVVICQGQGTYIYMPIRPINVRIERPAHNLYPRISKYIYNPWVLLHIEG